VLIDLTKLPVEQRERMYASFQRYFEMSPAQKQKVLDRLPDGERQRVERALSALEKLTTAERRAGLEAVGRLVSMTGEQQQQLFANAERWKTLPESERKVWVKLAGHLPPLPPGAGGLPPAPPASPFARLEPPPLPITNPAR
jgi:hypothetical protein